MQLTPLSTLWAPRKKNKKKGTIFFGHGVPNIISFPLVQISTQLTPKVHAVRQYTGELWAGLAIDVTHQPPVVVLHTVDLRVRGTLLATPAQTSPVDK